MANTPETRAPGRFRAAWLALMGHPIVPTQIRAEWAAWQLELEAICDKIGAAASRNQTRHKRELDRALAELDEVKAEQATPSAPPELGFGWNPQKRALNRQLLEARGKHLPTRNGVSHEHGVEAGPAGDPD